MHNVHHYHTIKVVSDRIWHGTVHHWSAMQCILKIPVWKRQWRGRTMPLHSATLCHTVSYPVWKNLYCSFDCVWLHEDERFRVTAFC